MIVLFILLMLSVGYNIKQHSKLKELKTSIIESETKFKNQINEDALIYSRIYTQFNNEIKDLNEQIESLKTPIVIEPFITVDEAKEIVKVKKSRSKLVKE